MIRVVTSITNWNDAIGKRISITFTEIDETTGQVLADNKRIDRVVIDEDAKDMIDSMMSFAQTVVDAL